MVEFEIDARLVRAAQTFMAKSDVRYYLNGFLVGKDHTIAGTDGHACFVSKHEAELPKDYIIALEAKVPMAFTRVNFTILSDAPSSLVLAYCTNERRGKLGKSKLIGGRVIDGKFPDLEKIIPDHSRKALDESEKIHRLGFNPDLIGKWASAFPGRWKGVQMTFTSATSALLLTPPRGADLPEGTMAIVMPMAIDKAG